MFGNNSRLGYLIILICILAIIGIICGTWKLIDLIMWCRDNISITWGG